MAASDEARRLLAKAAEDEYVLDRLLEDNLAPGSMVGFHSSRRRWTAANREAINGL